MANVPISNMTVTWTDSGTTYNAVKMNVTDTASNAASLLMDLQVGGVSKFKVPKNGNPVFVVPTSGFLEVNGNGDGLRAVNGSSVSAYGVYGVRMGASNTLSWGSSADGPATADTILARDTADTLAQRRATNAQNFRVYNTYTDASNYERAVFDWSTTANTLNIGTQVAGTGTDRQVNLRGSNLFFFTGGSARWNIDGNGHLKTQVDNTVDIGGSAANRPRSIYAGTSLVLATASFVANGSFPYIANTVGNVTQFNAPGGFSIAGNGAIGFTANATSALSGSDTIIVRDAANTVAQRNATSAQAFRVYNTFTDGSNYERGVFDWVTNSGSLTVGTQNLGTGVAAGFIFSTNSTNRWQIQATTGHFVASADNTYDIGLSGSNRPRDIYVANSLTLGNAVIASGTITGTTVRTSTAYTVATLPAAGVAGRRAYVTDATAPTFLGALTGGGAVKCPVFDNGTAWVAG